MYTRVVSCARVLDYILPQIQETAILLAAQMVSQGVSMETSEVADEVGYTGCCAHVCV